MDNEIFDYIIVGAGSAGCVLANRLSANPKTRVCLLEAGPEDSSPFIRVPMGVLALLNTRKYNWYYETEPEPELNNRRLYWPRGKTLGGSSSINAMVYTRGDVSDYDAWAALGNRGWSWNDLLPLFKRLENREAGATDYHGVGGSLNVAALRDPNPLNQAFVISGIGLGIPQSQDFNEGPQREGLGLYEVTQRDGQRHSAANAFLTPIRHRPNLCVVTGALVSKVLLEGKRAIAVQCSVAGASRVINASKEIILCGGAVNSPQLLLLSGIGPLDELAAHQIPIAHELQGVGRNLQDHLDLTLVYRDRSKTAIGFSPSYIPRAIRGLMQYLRHKRGFLTTNAAESGGFAKTDLALDRPDVQFHFIPSAMRDHGRKPVFSYGYTLHVCQLRPRSRGYIALRSANPSDHPRIHANYLSHPDDQATLVRGVRLARRLLDAESFAPHNGGAMWPNNDIESDEQILSYIRQYAETIYHPVGSCKMGNDDMAVVDDRLRVHGVEGLRIADASIMPTLIGGNTNAISMVIGEKAAEMIAADAESGNPERSTLNSSHPPPVA